MQTIVSGTYQRTSGGTESIRLDVDGRYPQMTVSGTRILSMTSAFHWIANLESTDTNEWERSGSRTIVCPHFLRLQFS